MERTLTEHSMHPDPFRQFADWFDEAVNISQPVPEAMVLATATPEGIPSARVVLLKGVDTRGFVFFTNYESRKGRELEANPRAEIAIWWHLLERQVRISGSVEKTGAAESDAYFMTRPRESRIGAHASQQSRVLESREELDRAAAAIGRKYPDADIPRPDYWGGYRLIPSAIEFWQGRTGRLHDRLRYNRMNNGAWKLERLAP
ncbi:MAG TPA: pyridoxamine 5'-phosphate oxidase [Bacteroidota bacterium]|nr:pyridoxamine 5'-phosphate oxidase [Bacteroidota bacterium]